MYSDWPSSYRPVHMPFQVSPVLVANRGKCVSTETCLKIFWFDQDMVISTSGENSETLVLFCALPLIRVTSEENGIVLAFQACKSSYWSCNWLFPNKKDFPAKCNGLFQQCVRDLELKSAWSIILVWRVKWLGTLHRNRLEASCLLLHLIQLYSADTEGEKMSCKPRFAISWTNVISYIHLAYYSNVG